MRRVWLLSLIPALMAGCSDAMSPVDPGELARGAAVVPSGPANFIVTLRAGSDVAAFAREHDVAPRYVYSQALTGFAGTISEAARAGLLRDARVVRIEPDGVVLAQEVVQSNATWGIDRVDQRALPLSGTYSYNTSGAGVTAYVVDTGLRYTHTEFGGRARAGFDAFGGAGDDCVGHGTHVAGTIGGRTFGLAKDVALVSVKVLGCNGSGTVSGVIAGLDWILANVRLPAVANLSLGGSASASLDDAVRRLVSAGVVVAVAAGNNNSDACAYSPARVPEALTVGATGLSDQRASFSNYGGCVDLYAPGLSIESADYSSDTGAMVASGTSMATPHVAGAAAVALGSTLAAADSLLAWSSKGIVTSAFGVNNDLLYLPVQAADPVPPSNAVPTADFSVSCSALDCTFQDLSRDSDGRVTAWSWTFGDGETSTMQNPAHAFAAAGTYVVRLAVTDDQGAVAELKQSVTVSTPSVILLSAAVSRNKNRTLVNLAWSGASGGRVDLYRNGDLSSQVKNSGTYSDAVGSRPTGTYTYRICETASTVCSAWVSVSF